jgi:flagellar hook capping protein FlgD
MPPEAQVGRALLKSFAVARHALTLLVAGLLVATATAFVVTERLKLEDSPVLGTQIDRLFSPVCTKCPADSRSAEIRFRLRREENITLDIADSNGRIIRRGVGSGVFGQSSHAFAWDGRDDSGQVVPDGVYKVELTLRDEKRTFEFPQEIQVDSTPPTIDVEIRHPVFSPDGDGRADRVDLRYRFSEPAFSILYLDGKRLGGSHGHKPIGTRQWYGRGFRPGEYRLALAAQDLAGNVAGSTREFTVRLRYVELPRSRYIVRGRSLRLRVSTDVKNVQWRLSGRGGTVHKHVFRIPVPRQPGSYRLTVSANGHSARATVVVLRARR